MSDLSESDDLRDLYRELILDHARKPRNFRRLPDATHSAEGINPLCGDKLHLYLKVGADEEIVDVGFEGSGCAISVASASLLTEAIAHRSTSDAEACFQAVSKRLTGDDAPLTAVAGIDLDKLRALDGVREYPARVKCATLAWHALHAALCNAPTVATTE